MRVLLGGAAVLLAVTGCGGGSAEAGCAGPDVVVSSTDLAPGAEVRVRARFLWADCHDTGQPGTPPPLEEVAVSLEQAGVRVPLTTAAPDDSGRIDVVVRVPGDAEPGPAAVVVVEAATPVTIAPG